jgi:hypothetical protein
MVPHGENEAFSHILEVLFFNSAWKRYGSSNGKDMIPATIAFLLVF